MFVRDILHAKGSEVYGIDPASTADEAVQQLVRYNIGSLVVFVTGRHRRMVGIITERDILRAQAAHQAPLERLLVFDVMSSHLVTTTAHASLPDVMRLMTRHRIRHLPVLDDDGDLLGIVSIGDLVKAHHDELETENHFMRSYINGEGAEIGTTS